jgi:hypothetical protein
LPLPDGPVKATAYLFTLNPLKKLSNYTLSFIETMLKSLQLKGYYEKNIILCYKLFIFF